MRPSSWRSGWAVVALSSMLLGCATSYHIGGLNGSYSSKRVSDNAYVVTFQGRAGTSFERVYDLWLYRCAELTLKRGYSLFSLQADQPVAQWTPLELYELPAETGESRDARAVEAMNLLIPLPLGPTITDYTTSATVVMYRAPLEADVVWALNAQKVQMAIKAFVQSDDDAELPETADVFEPALVAHATIETGGVEARSMATPTNGEGGLAPFKSPRSIAEVSGNFRASSLIELLRAYHQYRESNGDNAAEGSYRFNFTVRANGKASNIRTTESSFSDPEFAAHVQAILAGTNFGAREVADTDVRNFAISFRPQPIP